MFRISTFIRLLLEDTGTEVDGHERVSLVQHQHKYPALAKSRKEQIRPLVSSPIRN